MVPLLPRRLVLGLALGGAWACTGDNPDITPATPAPDGGGSGADAEATPGIALTAPATAFVRQGALVTVEVNVLRTNAPGPVRLALGDLPPGATSIPITIGDVETKATLTIEASSGAVQAVANARIVAEQDNRPAASADLRVTIRGRPGALDETFGVKGVAPAAGPASVYPTALRSAPDGTLVTLGQANIGCHVTRYTADGANNPSFGSAGTATLPGVMADCNSFDFGAGGTILVARTDTSLQTTGDLARLTPGGTLDPTFGTAGSVPLGAALPHDVACGTAGCFVTVAGPETVRRITSTGLDPQYVTTAFPSAQGGRFALSASGVVHLVAGDNDKAGELRVVRLAATGARDMTFAAGAGQLSLPPDGANPVSIASFAADAAGRLLVYGSGLGGRALVLRVTAAGEIDTTFGSTTWSSIDDTATSVGSLVPDVGDFPLMSLVAGNRVVLVRRTVENAQDVDFGEVGFSDRPAVDVDMVRGLALQPERAVALVNRTGQGLALVRWWR